MRNFLYTFCLFLLICSCNQQTANTKTAAIPANTTAIGCMPEISDKAWYSSGKKTPFFKRREGLHFTVSTKKNEVQRYFNQGLMLSFAFYHAEADRSFYEAARQDSGCAMAWWGFTYVLGPNYNAGEQSLL